MFLPKVWSFAGGVDAGVACMKLVGLQEAKSLLETRIRGKGNGAEEAASLQYIIPETRFN